MNEGIRTLATLLYSAENLLLVYDPPLNPAGLALGDRLDAIQILQNGASMSF